MGGGAVMAEDRTKQYDSTKHLRGKYGWDDCENKVAQDVVVGVISNYSWADGTKNVSLYLDVTGEVSEDAVELTHTPQSVTLTVQGKRLHLPNLAHDISGATFALKPAKSQL